MKVEALFCLILICQVIFNALFIRSYNRRAALLEAMNEKTNRLLNRILRIDGVLNPSNPDLASYRDE